MNKDRRQQIEEIIENLEIWNGVIEQVKQDEETYYNNMPESLQQSQRGEDAETTINELEEAFDELTSCLERLNGVIGK